MPRTLTRFWAVTKYELFWNLRKKKLLLMLVLSLLTAVLTLVYPWAAGISKLGAGPDVLVPNALGGWGSSPLSANWLGPFILFFFAIAVFVDSIPGEFEAGTIVLLVTKPVSRTLVFAAKYLGSFLTLLAAYSFLYLVLLVGAVLVYGPQNNLQSYPALFAGNVVGTIVLASFVLFLGSLKKSSTIASIGSFGIIIGISIIGVILESLAGQAWLLTFSPGPGRSGTIEGASPIPGSGPPTFNTSVASLGANLAYYLLSPTATILFDSGGREALSGVLFYQLLVAAGYIALLTLLSWFMFTRAQITEA